jgi:DNA-binding NtrC family response regulator
VLPVTLPPLRDRGDDVLVIAESALAKLGRGKRLSPQAARLLRDYDWPGNIRELENVIVRAALMEPTELISATTLTARPPFAALTYPNDGRDKRSAASRSGGDGPRSGGDESSPPSSEHEDEGRAGPSPPDRPSLPGPEQDESNCRSLTPSQRAALAVEALASFEDEARKSMAEGGRRSGETRRREGRDDSSLPSSEHQDEGRDDSSLPSSKHQDDSKRSVAKAAKMTGAGISATKTMLAVKRVAPALHARVKAGEITVAQARREAGLGPRH